MASRGAIGAAVDLVIDPNHAEWVKKYWGDKYLDTENAFYRMLLISAMTSGEELTTRGSYESRFHMEFLHTQAEDLAQDIDASPVGLTDDYPGQCYPTEIIASIAAIRRSDRITQADHTAFAQRAMRGFEGGCLDSLGVPPYSSDAHTGKRPSSRAGDAAFPTRSSVRRNSGPSVRPSGIRSAKNASGRRTG